MRLETTSPGGVVTNSLLEQKPEEKESLPSATRNIRLEGDLDHALEEIAKQENQSVSLIKQRTAHALPSRTREDPGRTIYRRGIHAILDDRPQILLLHRPVGCLRTSLRHGPGPLASGGF